MTKNTGNAYIFWLKSCQENYQTAVSLMESGRWNFSVFMCHQAVEAMLKACIILETGKRPPYIHNLVQLLNSSSVTLPHKLEENITKLNAHYIKARYRKDRFDARIYNNKSANTAVQNTKELIQWFTRNRNLTGLSLD